MIRTFINMALNYFNPMIKSFINTIVPLKNPLLIPVGTFIGTMVEFFIRTSALDFYGVSIGLLYISVLLIMFNTWTGASLSIYKYKKFLKQDKPEEAEKYKFMGKKLLFVLFKGIVLMLWIIMAGKTNEVLTGEDIFSFTGKVLVLVPVIMFNLYEFISGNKNIKEEYNKYIYISVPAMILFDALEKKWKEFLKIPENEIKTDI